MTCKTQESFVLYEALLWEPPAGYFLLCRHLARLARSAAHFGFAVDIDAVRSELLAFAAGLEGPRKVRVEVARDGGIAIEDQELSPCAPVRVAVAAHPIDSGDAWLKHKTSRRSVYEAARAAHPDAQDVLLWNERRELTESCIANLVLELDGGLWTPPVSCGLLPGTFRAYLLERGEIAERVLGLDVLERASAVLLINSVRRWFEARLPGDAASRQRLVPR